MPDKTPLCPCGCLKSLVIPRTGRRPIYASDACRKRVWDRRYRPTKKVAAVRKVEREKARAKAAAKLRNRKRHLERKAAREARARKA